MSEDIFTGWANSTFPIVAIISEQSMTILDKIVASKRLEIEHRRAAVPVEELRRRLTDAPAIRNFRAALDVPDTVRVIAEVKKASPSAGILREDFDPVAIARTYVENGAAALSVLTDEPFFQGKLSYLSAIRQNVSLPVLRKDFILEEYQLLEARVVGADAVLLIAEILDDDALRGLLARTHELGMQSLVELYEPTNLARVLDAGAKIIGINNRDLRTFVTRLEHTLDLAPQIPADCCLVSESGIRTREDVLRLQKAGVKAILVGESLMRSENMGGKLRELTGI